MNPSNFVPVTEKNTAAIAGGDSTENVAVFTNMRTKQKESIPIGLCTPHDIRNRPNLVRLSAVSTTQTPGKEPTRLSVLMNRQKYEAMM